MLEELTKKTVDAFKNNYYDDLVDATEEKKLLYLYALYHYYYGDEDALLDVHERCFFTMQNGNFAQGLFEPDSFEEKQVEIIIPYVSDNFSINEVIERLKSTEQTIIKKMSHDIDLSVQTLKPMFELWSPDEEDATVVFKIITKAVLSPADKQKAVDKINNYYLQLKNASIELIFADDMDAEFSSITDDRQNVEEGSLSIDKPNNYLKYGNDDSIIVNIKASSLRELYAKYSKSGLFSLNLRFYVPDNKVDPEISKSIQQNPEKFWFLNNGIIILCDDYSVINDKVVLKNFSIINGGQTTRMIGKLPSSSDFFLTCKVIKNKFEKDSPNYFTFASDVAQASNNQKPIKSEDLIANRPEQKLLKSKLKDAHIFMSVKRGDTSAANLKLNYPQPWMKTKNTEIAQSLYSFIYQKPGTSRNSKDKLFSNKNKYKLIFEGKDYNVKLLQNILYIKSAYKKWNKKYLDEIKKNFQIDKEKSETKKGLMKNSYFFFEACIGLISKCLYCPQLVDTLKNNGFDNGVGTNNNLYAAFLFNHEIFKGDYDDVEDKLFELFELVYDRYILPEFSAAKAIDSSLVYSNFTKTDKNYYSVAARIFDDFADFDNMPSRLRGIVNNLFHDETVSDVTETAILFKKAVKGDDDEKEEPKNQHFDTIKAALTEYRNNVAAQKGIPKNSVFTNTEITRIAQVLPTTVDELRVSNCFANLQKTKTKNYGKEIVEIINEVINKQ